jgi:hypothetical protein
MKRRVHFEIVTCCATEADPQEDSVVACNTQAELYAEHLTNDPLRVTCKRCLQRMPVTANAMHG